MTIGINLVVSVAYSYIKDGQIKIKRESAIPDRLPTIAHCLGLVGAKEDNVYIFKNFNYEQRLNRVTDVKNGDIIEIFDKLIIEQNRPDLFTKSRTIAYCLKIKSSIKIFEDAINNTTDKDKIAKYDEYISYLKSLCTLETIELQSKSINFDDVDADDEDTNVVPDVPIDILSKSYIP